MVRAVDRSSGKTLHQSTTSQIIFNKMIANQMIFLKLQIEEITKQLFGLIKTKSGKPVFEAVVDRDTLVTHDMPECPLLDGSLAFTEKKKITFDLYHHNNTNQKQVYVELFVSNVRDF